MEFWVLLGVMILGFVITWIACSKPVSEEDLVSKPGNVMMINPYDPEKESLRMQVYALERKLYQAHRELDYRKYDGWDLNALRKILEKPVEVNIENIVKVETNEANSKSTCR